MVPWTGKGVGVVAVSAYGPIRSWKCYCIGDAEVPKTGVLGKGGEKIKTKVRGIVTQGGRGGGEKGRGKGRTEGEGVNVCERGGEGTGAGGNMSIAYQMDQSPAAIHNGGR